jgi:uncharacterized RDD family membrane protein YckC
MRCPKCQYISFDSGERCRNCGYEFSLSAEDPGVDVSIGRDHPAPGRIRDVTALDTPLEPDEPGVLDDDADAVLRNAARRLPSASDLPLFTERVADDQAPLITPPAVPRPPLSVRRTNPSHRGRARGEPEELSLDLSLDSGDRPAEHDARVNIAGEQAASLVRRSLAGVIDLLVLGSIHAAVIYLTLRLLELETSAWRLLPPVPLAAFLLLLCGGYFVLFTAAGGQTIGKMAAGIRVIAASENADGHRRVSFAMAIMRAVACLGSVVALGAGFLPALLSSDRRAFHDRIAETRVVPA